MDTSDPNVANSMGHSSSDVASGEDNSSIAGLQAHTIFDKEPICKSELLDFHCYDPLFWGPYLSERQWGTVREDYSSDDSCWTHSTYENACRDTYRSGEDGLLGVSDKHGLLCASLALWNGIDPILKERLFGLSGKEGNHGEDVKELYYYLDNIPDHSYMHALYKYPQKCFPYDELLEVDRTVDHPEYELLETGVFENNEYWDIHVEYAKPSNPHLICKYTIVNKCSEAATLHIIPQFHFRKSKVENTSMEPSFQQLGPKSVNATYELGSFNISYHHTRNVTFNNILLTNNDTVEEREPESAVSSVWSVSSPSNKSITRILNQSVSAAQRKLGKVQSSRSGKITINKGIVGKKDAFHRYIINENNFVLQEENGTKVGGWMLCEVPPLQKACVYWQIYPSEMKLKGFGTVKKLDEAILQRKQKANDYYNKIIPRDLTMDQKAVCRQAYAGLMWSKQFYLYNGKERVNELRKLHGEDYLYSVSGARNFYWKHLDCEDILLMPDKWEFPWFASWDLALQAALYATVDLEFAKKQMAILLSDRYMHPSGQVPGCEFNFSDANPPLLAWAVWKIHKQEKPWHMEFIKTVYPRLLINYQWWQRLDPSNSHLFGNGFMGLDNISLIDRSNLPRGVKSLKQADATGWMAQFALIMLQLTLEQCKYDLCVTGMAIRFMGDFLAIAKAINARTENGGLWHEDDGFYYDLARIGKQEIPIRVRSWTGIIPLMACAKINLEHAPGVKFFLLNCSKDYAPHVCKLSDNDFFFTLVPYIRLKSILLRVFAEKEFLSPFGIRSISKLYQNIPLNLEVKGVTYTMTYQPGESESAMFGGNSNWRGPIWLCLNYLFIECLEMYSELDKIFTIPLSMDYPSGLPYSQRKPFGAIVQDLSDRITSIFTLDHHSTRPVHNKEKAYMENDWHNLVQFYEYFHAETGRGCGASHQTGWSALYVEFAKRVSTLKSVSRFHQDNFTWNMKN